MTVVVLCGVAILTALTLGYGFNEKDGRIEQGGILQIGSTPSAASVTINGTLFGSQTPTKLVSQPGDYALTINRPGYRQWQQTVPIQAGNITWATYARLIPQNITPENVASFPASLKSAITSPSSKRYAALPRPDSPVVTIAMLDSETVTTKEYAVPAGIYTEPSHEHPASLFTLTNWTGDEKSILMNHSYGDNQQEWLILNLAEPEKSININRALGLGSDVTNPIFSEGDGSELYALVGDTVRVINISEATVSRPIVERAVDFRLYSDKFVLYVANDEAADNTPVQHVGYVKKDYKKPRIVKTVPYDGVHSAQFDVGKYYDKYYYLVSHGRQSELLSASNMPNDSTSQLALVRVATLELGHAIIDTNVTDSGQFATVQDGYEFATYNLETNHLSTAQFAKEAEASPQKLRYLDGYLLWGTRAGQLRTYEFDGANQQDIMSVIPELGATLSPSAKYLYAFAPHGNEIALTRAQLLDINP